MSKDLNGYVICDECNKLVRCDLYFTCPSCRADIHNKCSEKINEEWYCPKCKTKVV